MLVDRQKAGVDSGCFENVKKLSMLMVFLILEKVTVSDVTSRTFSVDDVLDIGESDC